MTNNEGAPTAECAVSAETLSLALGQVLFAVGKGQDVLNWPAS